MSDAEDEMGDAKQDRDEFLAAITEILTIFDDDPQMTEELLSAAPGQLTAKDDALVRIRGIARTVLEGRRREPVGGTALYCCLCLHAREDAASAVTVINGQAVCHDHMGYVQGFQFSAALAEVKQTEASRQEGGQS